MDELERRVLESLRFDWAPTPESVWSPAKTHVDGLNRAVLNAVMAAFQEAKSNDWQSPLGVAITGQQGSGKTHMLGTVRAEVQRRDGYFFLVSLLHGKDFWQNIVHAFREGLNYPGPQGEPQLTTVLRRLAVKLGLPEEARAQIAGEAPLTRQTLDDMAAALRRADPAQGHACRYTARALVLLAARDSIASEVGEAYLISVGEGTPGERMAWGIHPEPKQAHEIVHQLSRLLALTGPSLLAIDQIDTLISQSTRSTDSQTASPVGLPREKLLDEIGTGLMELRETVSRTVTVVACQYHVWEGIRTHAPAAVIDRFRREARLDNVPTPALGRRLVEARFEPQFAELGFAPPNPTWPVLPEAFGEAVRFTPRQLFKQIDDHIRFCLDSDRLELLKSLTRQSGPRRDPPNEFVPPEQMSELDTRFAELVRQADPAPALDKVTEDVGMPALLKAGLRAYIDEQGEQREEYSLDDARPGENPALHARMRFSLDVETEDEVHWSFRAVAGPHPRAVQNRIERLRISAGLDPDVDKRKAYLLRTGPWPTTTPKTRQMLDQFRAAGGVVLDPIDADDLKTFAALEKMWRKPPAGFSAWLRHHKHAGRTTLFRTVFGEPGEVADAPPPPLPPPPPPQAEVPTEHTQWPQEDPDEIVPTAPGTISLGNLVETGDAVRVPLVALRKHAVIFAGSGSGKTVLIRRLVEECALQGVSSIVLDPNNDLARLGDAWPRTPAGWQRGDDVKAADYLDHTDVVIWTPRREAGRPLSFRPLPDLAAVAGDPDEFGLALDTAVAALAPRARADGATAKAERARAVLREALAYFAREGGTGLKGFLELLSDLPDDVTTLGKAQAMADDMAQTLTAAMINDPLFGGAGTPLDPGVLLTPPPGKRARISVISLIGLPTDQQRQSFVNQLQMALFAWIKQNPAGDRPLGGLFVMDEAQTLAPSGAMTACTASTLALASQARKYGLGLVFATQAPKGIHNRIVGNAATQYFGFINSPTQVNAAKEMAAAKASTVLDISRLNAGQFYAVGEGMPFQKVTVPMCLSHHPSSALTAEEVMLRAQDGA
jgi:hypothetical protein